MTNKYLKELGYTEGVSPSEYWEHKKGLMKGAVESNSAVSNLFTMYAIALSVGSIGLSLYSSKSISLGWPIALIVIAGLTLVIALINMFRYGVGRTKHRVAALHIADYRASRNEFPGCSNRESKEGENNMCTPVTH